MTIKAKGPGADAKVRLQANGGGNLSGQLGKYTVAGLAQNEIVAVSKIPAYSTVLGLMYSHAAMGANTALELGYETEDGVTSDPDAFATVADSSAAGAGVVNVEPFEVTQDTYVIVKQTGAGTGAGLLTATPLYIYHGV